MPAIGGSIESIDLAGRSFPVAADNEVQRKLGGFENEVPANGDGSSRLIKTRVSLSLTDVQMEVDDDRGDHEFLQDLADRKDFFPVVITFASGISYQGTGQITGELQYSSQTAMATASFGGSGKLTKQ